MTVSGPAGNGGVVLRVSRSPTGPELVSPYRGVYRGKREVEQLYADFLDTWGEISWEAEDLRELPGERVIVTNHLRAVGHGGGVRVYARGAHLWHFREGKAVSVRLFQSHAEAETAANQPG